MTKFTLIPTKLIRFVLKMNKFPKTKIANSLLFVRFLTIVVILYIIYFFGVLTHLFERDLEELSQKIREKPINNNVNEHRLNYTYIYKAEQTCATQKPPFLLILIKSKVTNFANREAIRNSWAQFDNFGLLRRVFLVGLPTASDNTDYVITNKINAENEKYNDIVQQNFQDAYYNNTVKTFMGIKWVVEFCPQVSILQIINRR